MAHPAPVGRCGPSRVSFRFRARSPFEADARLCPAEYRHPRPFVTRTPDRCGVRCSRRDVILNPRLVWIERRTGQSIPCMVRP